MKNWSFFLLFLKISNGFSQSVPFELMLNGLLKKTVSPVKVSEINFEKVILLDTRTKKEFDISHINNAQWVGYEQFNIQKLKNIPKERPIVVYCSVGARSEQIGEKLQSAGYKNVKNIWGGIFEWVNEGNLIVDKKGKPTQKVHAYSPEWGIWLQKGEKIY